MTVKNAIFLVAVAASPSLSLGAVSSSNIEGTWACDPYTMNGKGLTIAVVEQHTYGNGGSYSELSTSTIKSGGGGTVIAKSGLSGSWLLANDVIELKFTSGQFLSSSNPNYTLEMGQHALDLQLQKKNWSKMKVLEFHKRLVTTPVDPMYKEAKVLVTCHRTN